MEFQRGITDRQRVRLILADLVRANTSYERAKREYAEAGNAATSRKKELARVAVLKLQTEATRVVEAVGYYRDRERLAALLDVQWMWLVTVAGPILRDATDVGI